ncbi:MAG: DUF370 domain-containing protein [Lachnospiraceae bacterium]|nr:DUF370 domain-containing protein [Lachnospiraceae bacterium]MBQ4068575.1 DUF370 domain-containing protein [Lachnospiraceae bacterium]
MGKLMNVGYGNVVNTDKIVAVLSPESAPIKRMVQKGKDNGNVVDATQGRKTKSVIVMDSDHIVLSALMPDTIATRYKEE